MKTPHRILITGARSPAALEWTRLYGKIGSTIITADTMPRPLASFSRYSSKHECYASPNRTPEAFENDIARICETHSIEQIIPTCEETFWITKSISNRFTTFYPGQDIARNLHDKANIPALCSTLGFPAPEHLATPKQQEWVIKPRHSRSSLHTQIIRGTKPRNINTTRQIVQPRIQGNEYFFAGLAKNGTLLAEVCYRPALRSRPNASGIPGPSVAFAAQYQEQLSNLGRQVIPLSY